MDLILPFKVGGAIELRSFKKGYRGAWFRCKISDMGIRKFHMEYQLEHMDFPEEKRCWTRLDQIPPEYRKRKSCQNRELMLRPAFPQWYWDNHIPEDVEKMDVVAVVSHPWKVGDLIDWLHNDCFWTGKIIEVLGDGKVKIVCLEEPLGEGGCYEVDPDDLRPALDWSLEKGWSAPLSQENGESWYTARLIREDPDSSSSDEDIEQSYDGYKEVERCLNESLDTPKQELSRCMNGASVALEKVMDPDVKHPANTNGRRRRDEDEIDECCRNMQADYPASPVASSGQSSQVLTNGHSTSPTSSCKKLKTLTEHASVQSPAPDAVGEALMDVENLARKISSAEDLLQSLRRAMTPLLGDSTGRTHLKFFCAVPVKTSRRWTE